jgi:hypothetical protein
VAVESPTAEVVSGDCRSSDVLTQLESSAPSNPYQFVGEIDGTLDTAPPVAVVVRDPSTTEPIACAQFD